jgi:Uncharacterized protein conserved in bacteria
MQVKKRDIITYFVGKMHKYSKLKVTSFINFWYNIYRKDRGMDLKIGDVIKMKKQHPCGNNAWEIMRTGMDIRLKCGGCGHQVMLPRKQVEKSFRGFIEKQDEQDDNINSQI